MKRSCKLLLPRTLAPLAVLAFIILAANLAQAQATRTWVSGVGDDANPCSRTAPCKTFAGAFSKTAIGGEIDTMDSGAYGSFTVSKSMTIDGGEDYAGVLQSVAGGSAIVVNLTSSIASDPEQRVTLRRLSINGTGSCGAGCGNSQAARGIRALSFRTLDIEHCYIQNFTTAGIDVSLNSQGSRMSVKDTNISNAGIGVQMTTTGLFVSGTLDNVRIDGGTSGVIANDRAFITIRNTIIQACSTAGASIQGASNVGALIIENTMLFSDNIGVQAGGAGTNVDLSNTSIMYNATGIASGGGTVNSRGNNNIAYNTSPGVTPTAIGQQ